MKFIQPAGVALCLLAAAPVFAVENVAEYSARIWQSDEGLPLDAARAVAQTPDGFIWVGTQGGLARFDGWRFEIFDQNHSPGMTNAEVNGLRTAHDGSLWVVTHREGVYRLQNGKFQHFSKTNGLASDWCLGMIFEDTDGAIWVSTLNGLCRYVGGKFSTVSSKVVRDGCQDHEGNFWFATGNGVDCWSNGSFIRHLGPGLGLRDLNIRSICCDPQGNIWIGSADELVRVDGDHTGPRAREPGPAFNIVTTLYVDRSGTFWAGTYGGLFRIVDGRFVPELSPEGQPYDSVMQIFEDREGDLWVCSKDGLIRLKPKRVLCYTERQGLGNDNVCSVLEDRAGDLLIGTWGGGLNWLKDGQILPFPHRGAYPFLALALCEDRAGHIWAGSDYNGGLFDFNGERARHFYQLNGGDVPATRAILQDSASNIWIGTSQGLYQPRGKELIPYGNEVGLGSDVVRAILEDHEGTLWIGTQAGLVRERDGVFQRFTATNGLPAQFIYTLFEDQAHSLWLGTRGGGLVRYQGGVFKNYTTRDGLFSDNISAILEDDHGWLWMGSDRGIFRVKQKDFNEFDRRPVSGLRSVSYGKADGMVNRICNRVAQPPACKSRDGRLWFVTIKGLCVIDPSRTVLPEAPAPPVVIEELLTDQQTINVPTQSAEPIRLEPGRGELEFRYAALAYRAPEENRFRYKLDGVDSTWVEADQRRIAHYNNIYPGHYTFQVSGCNSDGVWNNAGASVAVVVLPHLWQRWWFKPALFALAAVSLVVLYKIYLHRRQEIDRLRLRIAADLHDDIGSNLASISLLSQLGQNNGNGNGIVNGNGASHFLNGQTSCCSELAEINRIALSTANGIREIVWFINPDYDTTAEMVARMRDVAGQLLTGVDYRFDAPAAHSGRKLSPEFRRHLFLIFKEIMHNVVKHSKATRVEIALRESHGQLRLRVEDDGHGFDTTTVTRGNGLRNIRLRTGQLGGTLHISRGQDGGAVVEVAVRIT